MFAKSLGLQWRFVPAKDYKIKLTRKDSPLHLRFTKKEESRLETKVATAISVLVLAVALILSSNFTGFTIAILTTKSLNIIGGILFMIGSFGLFFILKKSRQKK